MAFTSSVSNSTVAIAPAGATRAGLLGRLGATFGGAAAFSLLSRQRAALAVNLPVCCQGYDACSHLGCPCSNPGTGSCCWYCSIGGSSCATYQCCDRRCHTTYDNCICAFKICNCCP